MVSATKESEKQRYNLWLLGLLQPESKLEATIGV